MRKIFMLTAVIGFVATGPVLAGNIKAGEKVFKNAKPVMLSIKRKIKPASSGKYHGAQRGSLESHKKYSKAMKESGIVMVKPLMDIWKSQRNISSTKMAFAGLKKEKDRENVIAYLKSFSE